jgi:ABC-2 type transport system permease protein
MKGFRSLWTLTAVSIKMYFRNRTAVFFTLFLPLVFIAVFGLLSKSSAPIIKLDITNQSHSELASGFITALDKISTFDVTQTSEQNAANQLGKGKIDLQVIIPADFGQMNSKTHQIEPTQLTTHYNQASPGNGQTANLVLGQILAGINSGISHTPANHLTGLYRR